MKRILYIIILVYSSQVFAQFDTKFSLETQTGYEHNIFRSPDRFINEDDDVLSADDLLVSSFYQEVKFRGLLKYKWKEQSLTFRAIPRLRSFFSEADASYWEIASQVRYDNTLSKKTKWFVTARHKYRNREGINQDENEFTTPLGYRSFSVSSGLHFRLYKQNRTLVSATYGNKNYDATANNALSYNYYNIHTTFRNVFWNRHLFHSYGVKIDFTNRFYTREYTDEERANQTRDWKYISIAPFYSYPISEAVKITPSIAYERRIDADNNRFSYTQFVPELAISHKTKSLKFQLKGQYISRTFDKITATDINDDAVGKLKYKYVRLTASAEKKLTKNLSLTVNGYLNTRNSNQTQLTTLAFRSYDAYYAGIGLKWRF